MGVKSRGRKAGTRSKLKKSRREKFTVTKYLKEFKIGTYVAIVIDPSSKKQPFHRFHGLTGKIIGKRGRAYIVEVWDGNKRKQVFATPEHLKEIKVV
ncbi:MAG TPA: 50S ribosomal protein L21e [Nanoarchaeota archaeon]|nr:50S ribosomal protein L21e [Nanoarchaeota archaeon]